MGLSEERMQVLKMIESGAVSAEEGAQLLVAMGEDGAPPVEMDAAGDQARWMRVTVKDLSSGAPKVNVRLPVGLVGVGVKMGARFVPGTQGVEINDLVESFREGVVGKVAEAEDLENNEKVEIFLE